MEKYHIERRLAQGSTSSVFRVLRVHDRSAFVMKRISLESASPQEIYAAEREVQLYQNLDHPCIVGMVDHFEAFLPSTSSPHRNNNNNNNKNQQQPPTSIRAQQLQMINSGKRGDLCLILEPMFHGDLFHVLTQLRSTNQHQPIAESIVMGWFVQMALAMQYLHSKQIVYGDMKSSNVFVNDNTQFVAVGDLGSANFCNVPSNIPAQQQHELLLREQQQRGGNGMLNNNNSSSWEATATGGTPLYFSPERMLHGLGASYASDVWALGILLAEAASMAHPWEDCRDINSLIVRITRGDVPQLSPAVLAAAGSREMQNLINFMLKAPIGSRPTIDEVLRHPFVKKHLERFFTTLLAPPDINLATGASSNVGNFDRWNRFVVGTDKLNPHRVLLHSALEQQMKLFLPNFASTYFGRATPTSDVTFISQPTNKQQHHHHHRHSVELSIPPTNVRMQHHPKPLLHLDNPDEVKAFVHQTDHSLSPSRHYVNTSSSAANSPNNKSQTETNKRHVMHVGGNSGLMSTDDRDQVAPSHISPEALKPFLHQQIPLSKLRGQKTQAPFFTDDKISPYSANNKNGTRNNNNYAGENYLEQQQQYHQSPPSSYSSAAFGGAPILAGGSKGRARPPDSIANTIAPFLQQQHQQSQSRNAQNNNTNNNSNSLVSNLNFSASRVVAGSERASGGGPSSFAPVPYASVSKTLAKVLGGGGQS